MKKTVAILAAILGLSVLSYADIARPTNTPKLNSQKFVTNTMEISLDKDAKEAKLLIPRSQIKELRAALEHMDDGTDATAAVTSSGLSREQTIVSGLFMSLAVVFGGIWFARSGKLASKGVKSVVLTIGIAAIASAATFVYANAGPPAEARSITGKMFSQAVHLYGFGSGQIKVGISDDDYIHLIVPNPSDKPSGEE
jgi:hypothetical protein